MEDPFATLVPYGWSDRWAALRAEAVATLGDPEAVPARVVRHDGMAVLVATPTGLRHEPVRGSVDPAPVVGDWVLVSAGAVAAILYRTSLLRRQDPGREVEQPLVANVDAVFAVCGLDRPVKIGRIRRAATLAWDAGATPSVVLTKADLLTPSEAAELAAAVVEGSPGLDVVVTSTVTGEGIDQVRQLAADRTIVLLGESGAGKSSLTNALIGSTVAGTGEVRTGDAKGRHTTTSRQLHPLPSGGVLVDTPGLRAVGLWVDEDAVDATFDDIEELARDCRFNDCAHDGEPGCAVAAAVEAGQLAAERLAAWRTMSREAASAARRADRHAQRVYERRFGRAAKEAQRRKRGERDEQ